jgi:hypothetical protein
MQRMISILTFLVCLSLLPVTPAVAGWFSDDTLVSIDGTKYSVADFKNWWKFWKEADEALPKTPDPYIDWLLLMQEGERMGLADDPGFKRQERVFLQSRGLLMLKYEAVDSQIKVTDEEVKARYEDRYLPRLMVQRLRFKDEGSAMAAWQELSDGTLSVDAFLARDAELSGFLGYGEGWMRPTDINAGWVEIFEKTAVGALVDPAGHNKGALLYHIKDRKAGDDEDFALFSKDIRHALWKEKEDQLTAKLLRELETKYQVKVDQERLAAIDINAAADSFTDEVVISTSKENVSAKQFMAVVRKLLASRPTAVAAQFDPAAAEDLKKETAQNIVAQSVTNWESLDRNFQGKEPFKSEYDFNYRHRLVSMLEQRLFVQNATATDEEVLQHYQDNLQRYTIPAQARLYIIDETQGQIDQIWADFAVGQPFQQVVKQHLGIDSKPVVAPINHLDPEIKAVVEKLVNGETSQIFRAQGIRVLVHLVERTPESPLSLERVKESIIAGMRREKFDKARTAYLESLKAHLPIEVKDGQWKSIQQELGGA